MAKTTLFRCDLADCTVEAEHTPTEHRPLPPGWFSSTNSAGYTLHTCTHAHFVALHVVTDKELKKNESSPSTEPDATVW